MINRCFIFLRSIRKQFFCFFVVGITGLAIDMASLVFLKEVFGIRPIYAVIVSQIGVLVYNFSLNKFWSFENTQRPHKQAVRYTTLAGANYLFSVVVMYIFTEMLSFDYRIVRIASIGCMGCWNFFLYKYWVYKEEVLVPSLSKTEVYSR
tara:strand:- start:240 stop:689 length:450 start_codon:yes stop_codon:yes gene_type:complete